MKSSIAKKTLAKKYIWYKNDKMKIWDEDLDTNWLFTYVYLLQEVKDT